jgi:hypothetical protein
MMAYRACSEMLIRWGWLLRPKPIAFILIACVSQELADRRARVCRGTGAGRAASQPEPVRVGVCPASGSLIGMG